MLCAMALALEVRFPHCRHHGSETPCDITQGCSQGCTSISCQELPALSVSASPSPPPPLLQFPLVHFFPFRLGKDSFSILDHLISSERRL